MKVPATLWTVQWGNIEVEVEIKEGGKQSQEERIQDQCTESTAPLVAWADAAGLTANAISRKCDR